MYGSCLCNEYIRGLDVFINFVKKDMLDNIRGNLYCPCKHCKNEKKYHTNDVLMSHLIKHGFMKDYLEREVPTGVEEDHDDVNEADILWFTDDNIKFHVHNIEEMVRNVERHDNDDQYSNGKLAKYKKMIEDSNKSLCHGCATQYIRLFAMVKLFQLKASN
jgi:hypothetical protein